MIEDFYERITLRRFNGQKVRFLSAMPEALGCEKMEIYSNHAGGKGIEVVWEMRDGNQA
jgi:hypothetical protein